MRACCHAIRSTPRVHQAETHGRARDVDDRPGPEIEERRGRMLRRWLWPAVAGLVAIAVATGIAVASNGRTNDKTFVYAIGLWGDLPYSAVQADPGVPNLIADMNASKLEFTVHDGDLKAGNGPTANPPSVNCDDALYTTALGWFNSLEGPAMFTPGDNDWTACDRPSHGGFDSLDRVEHRRRVLFSAPYPLGPNPASQEAQRSSSERPTPS